MKLSSRSKAYMIPEYSLTGDLLSFLTCNLQYRYQNKGTLPPSMPIQLWFGEFIHGVMEEAYLQWEMNKTPFPWDWKKDIRPIENMIDARLQVRGLYPPKEHFFSTNHPSNENVDVNERDHKKLASARAERAINYWGPHLFPLIDSAELLIKGIRNMPHYDKNTSRSNYYGINGVIDVLSSLKINETIENTRQTTLDSYRNKIIEYLKNDKEFQEHINSIDGDEYEVIIDYKGMRRPSNQREDDETWIRHKWQILTYAWLRRQQADAKPIVAGIIFYLNELVPSKEDLIVVQQDIHNNLTDIPKEGEFKKDVALIENWDEDAKVPELSSEFKTTRSIRIININDDEIEKALNEFDNVVNNIESSLIKEIKGCKIQDAWKAQGDERTCDACDFKTFCKNKKTKPKEFTIP